MKKIKLAELTPDNLNANKGTQRGLGQLEKSLQNYGAGRSITVDKNGRIISGNKTTLAAASVGIEDAILVESDGNAVIVHKRTDIDIDTPMGRGLAIADNRVAELNLDWDLDALEELADQGVELLDHWTEEELKEFNYYDDGFDDLGRDLGDADEVPEVQEEPISKRGDLWILGDHRVLCGDSTSADDVARLMDGEKADMVFTDPPYGVDYAGGHFHGSDYTVRPREKLLNDTSGKIYTDSVPVMAENCAGPVYTWLSPAVPVELYQAGKKVGTIHSLIVWHKTNATYAAMGAHYKPRYELCLYWKPKKAKSFWCGASTENTLWEMKRDAVNTLHPTQKPVELAVRAISNHATKSVLDLFLGSGSTLIAAEETGRKCYGMELSPQYVDVIVRRWQEYTGKAAVHADGHTFETAERAHQANR